MRIPNPIVLRRGSINSILLYVLVLLAVPTAAQDDYLGMSLPADFRAFSSNSPWNKPIPTDAPIHPDSELMMTFMAEYLRANSLSDKVGINVMSWTSPIHVIDSRLAPRIDVSTTNDALYWTTDPDGNGIAKGIPMPVRGPWADPKADGHMILVDSRAMRAWEFSVAVPLGQGQWQASIVDTWDLTGPGWRPAFVGPNWWRSSSVGAGLPRVAGMIRPEEVLAGKIEHALLMTSPTNRKSDLHGGNHSELCRPASRSDGWGVGREFIPEGARVQLDPTLDLDAFSLSSAAKVVARAMQVYGMYVFDNAPGFIVPFQNLGDDGGLWSTPELDGIEDLRDLPIESFRVIGCETIAKDSGESIAQSVEFISLPKTVSAGKVIQEIKVQLVDGFGQPVSGSREFDVMISIGKWDGTNPGRSTLSGAVFKRTRNGVAVFDDLVIHKPGVGYRFFAMPVDLTDPFTVKRRPSAAASGSRLRQLPPFSRATTQLTKR